ncbi:MAG: hypothetical protein P1P74_09675 [Desulfuromonadales bacterium]|nr:hypothetical protein [Desulfuromonadales bacterium]
MHINIKAFFATILLAFFCPLIFAVAAHAYPIDQCAAERAEKDLNCVAQDFKITGISVPPSESQTHCVGGQPIYIDLDVTVYFGNANSYDIGLFFAKDGKDPSKTIANGGSAECLVDILPPSTPFFDYEGPPDTCGDGSKSDVGGGTGTGIYTVFNVPVHCQADALSGGRLYIPYVTTWDSQAGNLCTGAQHPAATGSKCNGPDGSIESILLSTVALVVLPDISKTDGITTLTAGDSTTYNVVITNTTGAPLSNAIFQDPAVANLTIDSLGCSAAGGATCPASLPINTMQGGGIIIPPMPVNSSVTFTVGATVSSSAPAGSLTNTAIVTVDAESNSAVDVNDVTTRLVIAKSFVPSSISVNDETALTITLQNTNLAAATGVTFTDNYPTNLINATLPDVTNTCGGSVTAVSGGTSLALSGGTISASGSCTITAQVTSAVGGVYTNSTGAVTSTEGYVGASASASLAVGVSNLSTSSKSWQDLNGGEPDPGDTLRYTITLKETAGVEATGVSVSDTVDASLENLSVFSCPAGATCSFSGQDFTATGITIPASGTVTVAFEATIPTLGVPAGTVINNCADINNPGSIGASPCSTTLIVSPSAVAGAGNKRLYLHDSTLSRIIPASGTPSTITKGGSKVWPLSPALASPVTISPDIPPLAIVPVSLYLASNAAAESRTVQVDVSCSGGGVTYSETKIFDGTAVNNPYLPITPTLVTFNNLTISADHFCAAGQTWDLTVRNTSPDNRTRNVIVHPVSGGNNSFISLPSLNIINVDSVTGYDAAYSATTTPANGYFSGGQTVYLRAVVSDPFGSFDITSAAITINKPNGTAVITNAAMTEVADSGTLTKTYEYAYTLPITDAGLWAATVTAEEGSEGTISDDGAGAFKLGNPNLTVLKSASGPTVNPGDVITYSVQIINSGNGAATNVILTDHMSPYTAWQLDFNSDGPPEEPFNFAAGTSGLTMGAPDYSSDGGTIWGQTPTSAGGGAPAGYDGTITNWKLPMTGNMAPDGGSFTLRYKAMVK